MINRIKFGWNFFRWLRLALGIMILFEGITSGVAIFVLFGLIFTLMPLLNMGCCSTSSCGIDKTPFNKEESEDLEVVYEEINTKKN